MLRHKIHHYVTRKRQFMEMCLNLPTNMQNFHINIHSANDTDNGQTSSWSLVYSLFNPKPFMNDI